MCEWLHWFVRTGMTFLFLSSYVLFIYSCIHACSLIIIYQNFQEVLSCGIKYRCSTSSDFLFLFHFEAISCLTLVCPVLLNGELTTFHSGLPNNMLLSSTWLSGEFAYSYNPVASPCMAALLPLSAKEPQRWISGWDIGWDLQFTCYICLSLGSWFHFICIIYQHLKSGLLNNRIYALDLL